VISCASFRFCARNWNSPPAFCVKFVFHCWQFFILFLRNDLCYHFNDAKDSFINARVYLGIPKSYFSQLF